MDRSRDDKNLCGDPQSNVILSLTMSPKNHKENLLSAASDLIYRKGYHTTSIKDIALSSGETGIRLVK